MRGISYEQVCPKCGKNDVVEDGFVIVSGNEVWHKVTCNCGAKRVEVYKYRHTEFEGPESEQEENATVSLPVDADGIAWTGDEDYFFTASGGKHNLVKMVYWNHVRGRNMWSLQDYKGQQFLASSCYHMQQNRYQYGGYDEPGNSDLKDLLFDYACELDSIQANFTTGKIDHDQYDEAQAKLDERYCKLVTEAV